MKTRLTRRILSLLLAVAVIVMMIPSLAFATENNENGERTGTVVEGGMLSTSDASADAETTPATDTEDAVPASAVEETVPSTKAAEQVSGSEATQPDTGNEAADATSGADEGEEVTFPVKITLVDADGTPLPGATLTLEDDEGQILKDRDGKEIGKWDTTDEKGKEAQELQLKEGSYVLKETKAPAGYKQLENDIKIKVDASGKVEIIKEKDADGTDKDSALSYVMDDNDKAIENELLLTLEKEEAKARLAAPRKANAATSNAPRFDITWINADSSDTLTLSDNNHTAKDVPTADTTNASDHHLEAQVTFSIGHTETPVPAGGVQIKVPARIYTDYDGKAHGETIVGVTQKPTENDKLFWYYFVDKDGNPVTTSKSGSNTIYKNQNGQTLNGLDDVFIVIENSQAINNPSGSRSDFTCMINYGYRPSAVNEDNNIELKADYSVSGFTKNDLVITNDTLKAKIDTKSELTSVSKSSYKGGTNVGQQYDAWDSNWGEKPASIQSGDYIYVVYDIRATVSNATQPYTLSLKEIPGNKGEMVAYYRSGWYSGTQSSTYVSSAQNIKSALTAVTAENPGPVIHVANHGSSTIYDPRYYSTAVVVAYPKSEAGIGKTVTNKVEVTLKPDSSDPAQTKDANTSYVIRDVNFIYDGDMFRVDKRVFNRKTNTLTSSMTVDNGKFLLDNDLSSALYTWVIRPYAKGYALAWDFEELDTSKGTYKLKYDKDGNPIKLGDYTIDTFEDMIYLNGELLDPGDYTFTTASYGTYGAYQTEYDFATGGEVSSPTDEIDKPILYYRTARDEAWISLGEKGIGETVTIPQDAAELRWSVTGDSYKYYPHISINMYLNPTEHVLNLLGGDDVASAQVINVASMGVKDYQGKIRNSDGENSIGGDAAIKSQVMWHDQNNGYGLASGEYLQHDRATQILGDVKLDTTFEKNEVNGTATDDNAEQISTRTYRLTSHQPMAFATDDPTGFLEILDEIGIEHGQKEIYFYDLLPESAELDRDFVTARYYELTQAATNANGSTKYDSVVTGNVEITETRNWRDSNRTLAVFKVTFPDGERSDWGENWNQDTRLLQLGTEVQLDVRLIYEWENLAFYGKHVTNYAAAEIPGSIAGSPDDLSVESSGSTYIPDDLKDVFKNISEASGSEYEGNDTYYSKQESDFNIATSSRSGYSKSVKSDIEATYRANSAAVSDGQYTYRLRYQVEKASEAKNIIIYDVLEEAWSEGENKGKYEETNRYWRGTFNSATASQPQLLGADPVIYYSTTDRKTMQEHLNTTNPNDPYANLANSQYWTTTEPDDKSSITAVAFDLRKDKKGNEFVLKGGNDATSVIYLYITMDAPTRAEVLDYNGEGPLMDPIVYAYNNSFLTISSKSAAGEFSTASRAISDGTTVRIAEPNPEIHKNVTDLDSGEEDGEVQVEHADLEKRNEPFKYEIDTTVPTFGNESSGQREVNKWTVVDELEPVLEMVKKDQIKITIGNVNGDKYFSYDASTNQYTLKIKTGETDSTTGEAKWIDESAEGLPKGFALVADNQRIYNQYGITSTSTLLSTNTLKLTLGYDGFSATNPETTKDTPANPVTYDRVDEFAGEPVHIEFYARIRDGVSLGKYEDAGTILVPNQAKYIVPNKNNERNVSEKVTVTPPDEPKTPPKKKINGVDAVFYLVDSTTGSVKTVTDEDGNESAVKLTLNTETGNYEDADGNVVVAGENEEIKTQYEMDNETETVSYTISGKIPQNASTYTLSDTLEDVLEFVDADAITINIKGVAQVYELDAEGNVAYDDEGVPKTVDHEYNRTLTWKEAQALSSTAYSAGKGFTATLDGQVLSLTLDEDFVNEAGDAVVSSSKVNYNEVTDEETGEVTINNPSLEAGEWADVSSSGKQNSSNKKDFGLSGANIEITFKAKIKDGADLSLYGTEIGTEIPNVATHRINTNPEENSDPVVIVPPTPPIFKRVNNKTHENLDSRNQVFNYLINVKIPDADEDGEKVTSLVIYDELVDVLEFQNVGADGTDTFTAKIVGEDNTAAYTLTAEEIATARSFPDGTDGQKIEFSLPQELIQQYPNYRLAINFDARIRADKTVDDLAKYRENNVTRVPNESNYKINDKFDYKSNKVTVTPPDIGKTVNNVSNYTVQGLEEVFEYEVTAIIPTAGEDEEITAFALTDDLNDVVEFANEDETKASIAGEDLTEEQLAAQVKRDGQNITFSLTKAQIAANGGKVATLSFKAKIKEGADITPFVTGTGIPNQVKYIINDDPTRTRTSRPVYVNPPDIGKLVNEKQHEDLGTKDEVFTYKITALIPKTAQTAPDEEGNTKEADVTSFYIKDEIKDVLEFAEEDATTVKVGDTDLTEEEISAQVVREGQLIRLDLTEEQVAAHRGEYVNFEFRAKIRDDADLAEYITDDGSVKVPNTSTKGYNVPNGPEDGYEVDSNEVTVTPPRVEKKVNDNYDVVLGEYSEVFTYTVETYLPSVADKFEITDTVEDVVEIVEHDSATVTVDGAESDIKPVISDDNKTITATFEAEDLTEETAKKQVILTFKAKLQDNANLTPYMQGMPKVPNKATITLNDNPNTSYDSNPVTVTPPPVEKEVNHKKHEDLKTRDEIFEYEVHAFVPEYLEIDADGIETKPTKFILSDTLVDELTYLDDGEAAIAVGAVRGEEEADAELTGQISVSGQTVNVELTEAQIAQHAGKYILLTFNAQIKDGANVAKYYVEDEDAIRVPNKATLELDDDPKWLLESNTVTITPPDPEEPPIEKLVNDKQHEDLAAKEEVFTYTIKTAVPTDAISFVVTDILEDVLEFTANEETTVTIGDSELTPEECAAQVTRDGQLLTLTLTEEQLESYGGKALTLSFKAKIKATATARDLQQYLEDGKFVVPNTASYVFENSKGEEKDKETPPVTVTPPNPVEPPIEKLVNDKHHEDLASRDEVFQYTITTAIPEGATNYILTDTLVDELQFAGTAAVVEANGEKLDAKQTISGQTLTVSLSDEQIAAHENEVLTVKFDASIKEGVSLAQYRVNGKALVPNTAEYAFTNALGEDVETPSNTVTVTPPTDEPPIEKAINNKEHHNLASRKGTFSYSIRTVMPGGASSFVICDTLVDEITFAGNADSIEVLVNGKAYKANVTIKGQDLAVTFDKDEILEHEAESVEVNFDAKIKEGADVSKYKVDGKVLVPNTARYELVDANGQGIKKDSNTVTLTPPRSSNALGKLLGVKTGDTINMIPWVILILLAAGGLVALRMRSRRRQ